MDKLEAASVEQLSEVEEIGQIIAESVHEYLHGEYGRQISRQPEGGWRQNGCLIELRTEGGAKQMGYLAGKTLVVTGTLVNYKRDEIKAIIEEHGGTGRVLGFQENGLSSLRGRRLAASSRRLRNSA